MDEKIEKNLQQIKQLLYVNQELKKELRQTFTPKRKNTIWRNPWFNGLLAAIVFFAFYFTNTKMTHVSASSLNIANAISFFDIGSGEISVYKHLDGKLYVSIENKGIYVYEQNGLTKVSEAFADQMADSIIDGELLFSQNGRVFAQTLASKEITTILEAKPNSKYNSPTWKDSEHIFVTKSSDQKEAIVEVNLKTLEEKMITNGSKPVYIANGEKLVFQRGNEILIKILKNGEEQLVDEGIQPAVSKDGAYVAYIKNNGGVVDVWIKDVNLKTAKQVSTNLLFTNEKRKQQGLYNYTYPSWSSNESENSLYVLKQRQDFADQPNTIMKIALTDKAMSASETVERFFQALIVRDDDFAKSMMENPPEYLTYSNPHYIGYEVIHAEEKNGATVVTAKAKRTDTANPYYQITTYEFELKKKQNRYMIENVKEVRNVEVTSLENNAIFLVENGEKKERLFSLADVPKEFIKTDAIRISSVTIGSDGKEVIFSLQEMNEDKDKKSNVTILKFDREQKTITFVGEIQPKNEQKSVTIMQLSLDATGQYVACDVYSDGESHPDMILFDVKKGSQVDQFNSSHSLFWQGEKLFMQMLADGEWMLAEYTPKTNEKKVF